MRTIRLSGKAGRRAGWRCSLAAFAGPILQAAHSSATTPTAPPPEQPRRQKQQCTKQGKARVYGDADQPQWPRQKPDNGKKNQRHQRDRPAQHEQNAPTDKENQRLHSFTLPFSFLTSQAQRRRPRGVPIATAMARRRSLQRRRRPCHGVFASMPSICCH